MQNSFAQIFLQFVFGNFLRKNIDAKAAHKMLLKLTFDLLNFSFNRMETEMQQCLGVQFMPTVPKSWTISLTFKYDFCVNWSNFLELLS